MDYIRIRSSQDGFRRGGVAHSKDWKEYPLEKFSDEQLEQIKEEPKLQCEIVERDDPDAEPNTVAELTDWLKDRNVEVPSGAKKDELVALYQENKDKQPEGGSE